MGDQLRQLDDFAKRAQRKNDALLVKSATKARRMYRNIGWDQASDQIQADGGDPAVFGLSSPVQRSRILDVVATVLREARRRPIDREPQAILYVDHKESARLLKEELDQISRTGPKVLRWIRPGLMLGTGQSKTSSGQVLDDFREMRVNVLVATSCVREGLDVPGCNIVIAVEPPHSKLDNIQLKGRARALHAKYVVICHDDEQRREFNSMVSQPDERLPVAAASQANENDASDTASIISATSDDAVLELVMDLPCSGSGKESVGKQRRRSKKEELELAMALSLSEATAAATGSGSQKKLCKCTFGYEAANMDELTMMVGDIITITKQDAAGWWEGTLNGKSGVFPENFVDEIKIVPFRCQVTFDYLAAQPDELTLKVGDVIAGVDVSVEGGWWEGVHPSGKKGWFPDNFVKKITPPAKRAQPWPSASARSGQRHTASSSAADGGGDSGDGGGNGGDGDARSFVAEGVTDDAGAPKRWPTEQKARKAWCRQRFGFGWQQQVDVQVKRSRLASAVVYPA